MSSIYRSCSPRRVASPVLVARTPRELAQEYSAGQTLGFAFCAGLCSFKAVKRIVEGEAA